MSDGDSKQLVKDMVQYQVKISQESCRLMKKEFSFLFEATDQKLKEQTGQLPERTQNVLVQMLVLTKIAMIREKISWGPMMKKK